MIVDFRHKGLRRFFETGSKPGINADHARKRSRQLAALDRAQGADDMNIPGWFLHALQGDMAGHWAIRMSGNWRLTFKFEGTNAVLVDYRDYH